MSNAVASIVSNEVSAGANALSAASISSVRIETSGLNRDVLVKTDGRSAPRRAVFIELHCETAGSEYITAGLVDSHGDLSHECVSPRRFVDADDATFVSALFESMSRPA